MMREVAREFRARWGRELGLVRAPGRVNIIGEHTDYNDGWVLPVAIDRYVEIAFGLNDVGALRGYSLSLDREDSVRLDALETGVSISSSWLDYAAGVAWALGKTGLAVQAMDLAVGGDLPMGAGLSSSAALEIGIARALFALAGVEWDPRRAVNAAVTAENHYVGMPCGVMDQMAVALSEPGAATLLDCRSLAVERVAIPDDWAIVIMDTGTRRELATSAYEERPRACERAPPLGGVRALRDASLETLERARSALDETTFARARHVVEENARVVEMVRALRSRDAVGAGELMERSHASLRDLFEVSTPELDRIVELARRHRGCIGARMTGAGFGGSAVALVAASEVVVFASEVEAAYHEATGKPGRIYPCRAVGGTALEAFTGPPLE